MSDEKRVTADEVLALVDELAMEAVRGGGADAVTDLAEHLAEAIRDLAADRDAWRQRAETAVADLVILRAAYNELSKEHAAWRKRAEELTEALRPFARASEWARTEFKDHCVEGDDGELLLDATAFVDAARVLAEEEAHDADR